ncbi:hypothetical protein KQX54_005746 [Cotesia glomerata]|uniref:Uncharacterized protein n=1 Tax=Cotesia glomerata TaxID=32391 RepID=A0AAV7IBR9_COTGL|nr:hypothetical protein KQX54_005746 [Cotesia glomerata]
MATKIFLLSAIVQALILSVYSDRKVKATFDLLKNPEIDDILHIAEKRFVECLSAGLEDGEKLDEGSEEVWLNKAQVKVIDGIKNYEIKAKFFPSSVSRVSYSHSDCLIVAKGDSVESIKVNCYFFQDGKGCTGYYDINEHILRDCQHNVIKVYKNRKC